MLNFSIVYTSAFGTELLSLILEKNVVRSRDLVLAWSSGVSKSWLWVSEESSQTTSILTKMVPSMIYDTLGY